MRDLEETNDYRRDLRRERRGRFSRTIEADLMNLLELLATDQPLPKNYRDHPLKGDKKGIHDCHIYHADMVLLYRKPDPDTLQLVRLGSHSELGIG